MLKSHFLFSDMAVKAAKSENNKGFSTSEKAQIKRTQVYLQVRLFLSYL